MSRQAMLASTTIGRFEIRDFLGRGALGDVFLAWDPQLAREVALKVIRISGSDPDMLESERTGATLQAQLARAAPQVAPVFEQGTDGDFAWVAMEYVAGDDLSHVLADGPLPEARAVAIAIQLCQLLEVCHEFSAEIDGRKIRGIVHGDINPQSIRLQEGDRVRVLGFGIARHLTARRSFTANLFGRLPYAAPERLARSVVDRQSDLWAVAVVLYEMASGRLPFRRPSAEEMDAEEMELAIRSGERPPPIDCSPPLWRILERSLTFEADRRYPSAAALRADLEQVPATAASVPGSDQSTVQSSAVTLPETRRAGSDRSAEEPARRPRPRFPFHRRRGSSSGIDVFSSKTSTSQLDHLPAWLGVALGLAAGGGVAVALLSGPPAVAVLGFVLLLGLAGWMVGSAQPVEVAEVALPPPAAPFEAVAAPVPAEPPPPAELDWQAPELARARELVPLPGGVFEMGSPEDEEGRDSDESPLHEVRVSAFACMRYPVTRRLYKAVAGEDPGRPEGEADDRPVNNVSWEDAVRFCNRWSEREGLDPCYEIREDGTVERRGGGGYRLPTEAEWEYACRAGTRSRWSFGDEESELDRHAWHTGNSGDEPQPVGRKEPNPWGLHDLHGNVWEWVGDWYGDYDAEPQTNPTGPATGDSRVLRGGSFILSPRLLRSALRDWDEPTVRLRDVGFRCVRASGREL